MESLPSPVWSHRLPELNANEIIKNIKSTLNELAKSFPPG
jgi:hypothetical protein